MFTAALIKFCFSAWAKKTDTDLEAATLAALDEKEEIPIIPYSSLFILSSENRYGCSIPFSQMFFCKSDAMF